MSIAEIKEDVGFRPQQGLPIMNFNPNFEIIDFDEIKSFRPQQGLPIMNSLPTNPW